MTCPHCSTPMLCPHCLRSQRIKQGIAASSKKSGRKPKHGDSVIAKIHQLRDHSLLSISEIAKATGVPKSSVHRLMMKDA